MTRLGRSRVNIVLRIESHFVRMSKIDLDGSVCFLVYLLNVGNQFRAIAFEKMLLPRAAFEKKLLAGTLSLISKVTAEHFVRMSKFELECDVCLGAYLLHVGNDLIALLVARPRRGACHAGTE